MARTRSCWSQCTPSAFPLNLPRGSMLHLFPPGAGQEGGRAATCREHEHAHDCSSKTDTALTAAQKYRHCSWKGFHPTGQCWGRPEGWDDPPVLFRGSSGLAAPRQNPAGSTAGDGEHSHGPLGSLLPPTPLCTVPCDKKTFILFYFLFYFLFIFCCC